MTDWTKVEFFEKAEWQQDPDRVQSEVIYILDEMRRASGRPIQIHEAWGPDGHVEGSAHYQGLAVDFHFVGWSLLDQWLFTERFPWEGIGLYPFWNQPGLHVDLRREAKEHPHLGRRWWRDPKGVYRAVDRNLLGMLVARSV